MKKNMVFPDREFLRFLPRVIRARDFHLYLEGGIRLVDLWLQGGNAVLGHKPPLVLKEMKNAAERGLYSPLPHPMEGRFLKALTVIFPERAFRLYLDSGTLSRALEAAGFSDEVPLWRPFLEPAKPDYMPPVLMPILPYPLGPELLVLDKNLEGSFHESDLIPPVILAPATRALYNMIVLMKAPGNGRPRFKKIEKVLKNSPWQRQGIYLSLKEDIDRTHYKALFLRFLEGGFLIPSDPREPIILPMTMSDGEESKLSLLISGKV